MALIVGDELKKINKSKNAVHRQTKATYSVFIDTNGQRYFQLDTYGSTEREFPEKISQSIQLDKETAKYLIQLLRKELMLND